LPLDALHLNILGSEFNSKLQGGRIDKITAPNFFTARFAIYSGGKTHGLVLNLSPDKAHARLTSGVREELSSTPVFITHLKKHLLNGTIDNIFTIDNERILHIEISNLSDLKQQKKFTLIAEFMGKHSNLILVDENNKITESLKHIPLDVSSKRQVLPGLTYNSPPLQDKISPFDTDALKTVLKDFDFNTKNSSQLLDELASFLQSKVCGLSPKTIKEVVFTAINSSKKLTMSHIVRELTALKDISTHSPSVSIDTNNKYLDFYFKPYNSTGETFKETSTLNGATDLYYSQNETQDKLTAKARTITQIAKSALTKAQKRLAILLERENSAKDLEEDKIKGELITANIYKIKRGDNEVFCENYYVSPVMSVIVRLDPLLSPSKNADKYFKSYQKKKKTLESLVEQLEQTNQEVEYLSTIMASLQTAETLDDLDEISLELADAGYGKENKKQKKPSKSKIKTEKEERLFGVKRTEFDGYTILTGKNNLQNDALVRFCSPNDLWLHPQEFRGAHTIILNPKKSMPPDKVIKHAAKINAQYSKAKLSENIPIDYTHLKFVLRPRSAPPGKVVYTNQKTIFVSVE